MKRAMFVCLLFGILACPGFSQSSGDSSNENLILASRNVEKVELANPTSLNTYQLLRCKNVLFTRAAIEALDQRLKTEEA